MNDLAKLISAIALVAIAACGWLYVQAKTGSTQNFAVVQHSADHSEVGAFNKQTGELIIYNASANQFNIIDFSKKIKYDVSLGGK